MTLTEPSGHIAAATTSAPTTTTTPGHDVGNVPPANAPTPDNTIGGYVEGVLARLPGVDAHDTENLIVMLAWWRNENSACNFNPYGCEVSMPGAKQCAWVTSQPVKSYPDWATGTLAMANTITNNSWDRESPVGARGPVILEALQHKGLTAESKARAIGMSGWNTGPNDPAGTLAGRAAYAASIVAHCGYVRTNLQAIMVESLGGHTPDPSAIGNTQPGVGPVPGISLPSWAGSLGKALAWLTDPSHWWQIGRVASGLALIGIGSILVFGDIARSTIAKAPGGAAIVKGAQVAKAVGG